jgi:hypothetical protein
MTATDCGTATLLSCSIYALHECDTRGLLDALLLPRLLLLACISGRNGTRGCLSSVVIDATFVFRVLESAEDSFFVRKCTYTAR